MKIDEYIRCVPDFPRPGILFRDITPLIANPKAFSYVLNNMLSEAKELKPDLIAGIESRGFIFSAPLAYLMGLPNVLVRKAGKLPSKTLTSVYELEYGTGSLQIHADSITPGQRVVIVDDLLATGGTLNASCGLIEQLGGEVVGILVLIELEELKGRDLMASRELISLIKY